MKRILHIIIFISSLSTLIGQPTGFNYSYRSDTFSTSPYGAYCIFTGIEVSDTAYYLIGRGLDSSIQYNVNPWYETGLYMQIDTNGQVVNNRLFKNDSSSIYFAYNLITRDSDGNLLCIGRDNFDVILYNINDIGDTLWSQRYIGEDSLHAFEPAKIVATKDKGYFLVLNTFDYTPGSQDRIRGVILKTDSLGNEEWRSEYAALGFEKNYNQNIIELDSQYVIFGLNTIGNSLLNFNFKLQTQIRKIDNSGNVITEYLSSINRWIRILGSTQTQDGGFVFCGREGTQLNIGGSPHMIYRGYAAKVDSNLQLVWEKGFGSPNNTMYLRDVEELEDGSLILAGHRSTFFPNDIPYADADSTYSNGWLLKMSANGDSLWQRLYRHYTDVWYIYHTLDDIEILSNGGFIAAGYSEGVYPTSHDYRYWGLLIRTDSFGCIVPGCQLLDNTENISVLFDNDVTVYPNPASEVVHFRFDKAMEKDVVIRVYSGLGQLVGQTTEFSGQAALPLPQTEVQINVSDFNSGMYYYGVYVEGRLVKQGQILVGD